MLYFGLSDGGAGLIIFMYIQVRGWWQILSAVPCASFYFAWIPQAVGLCGLSPVGFALKTKSRG